MGFSSIFINRSNSFGIEMMKLMMRMKLKNQAGTKNG